MGGRCRHIATGVGGRQHLLGGGNLVQQFLLHRTRHDRGIDMSGVVPTLPANRVRRSASAPVGGCAGLTPLNSGEPP